ncbi:sensor histidine kinase [Aureimonas phyllosphaerae]|uniref:Blue-light-activated histidine kinase n=1 Tax=Aureimonas phyllosphaerae TaxID=1166078 RepID=A0A7W6BN07_9HYPH|nr:PAS domain-containing protein [Aureimonas phyllosphaerae]MBB3934984.1 PAS domain S-box-containing protein [Aureimonas phyllosphaerae]MBB3958992.1 PAS domain S-box-containing protein [Aureimonas phyllosphaerae]SFF40065.1 PAS domain S-box-containing protein [Aureimonas phyllosphaerae]
MNRLNFHQLFDALPSPHMIVDRDLHFVAANPAYENVTGRKRDELIGRFLFDCFPSEGPERKRLEASIRRVFETGKPDTLAFIEYEIPISSDPADGLEKRYWSAVHSPLCDEGGQVIFALQNTVDITELVRLRTAAGSSASVPTEETALLQRTREIEEAYRTSRSQLDRFRHLFEQAPGLVALLRGPDHTFTFANRAYRLLAGDRELRGLPTRDVFPEAEAKGLIELLDRVYATGEAFEGSGLRVLASYPTGGLRELFLDVSFHPVRDDAGAVEGIFVQGYDRTESVRSHHRQRLLIDELNHRVKNTLSTIQSLARPSFRADRDREEARRAFEARIVALSNAHNLLSERHWESADLETILLSELRALDLDRMDVEGSPLRLNAKAAIAMAMVFHELASNALKYGALSSPNGRLSVRWSKQGDAVVVEWRESLDDERSVAIQPGFGMRMLERIVTGELEGQLSADTGDGGLIWTLRLPAVELEEIPHLALT